MKNSRFVTTLRRIHQRLNGSTVEYNLTRYFSSLREIGRYEATLKTKTDRQLEQLSRSLSVRARQGATLDALLMESYALVREAVSRTLQLYPYDVQMIGAMALHEGKVAEMETGEGKTLTAVFPSYLNGLTRRGVHVLTFNDYLARRDAEWMGPVYLFLGMTVGYVQEGMTGDERRRAYSADIMYATAKEAGFDYLRDTLCRSREERVQRPFNFAIVDEADSILIDEARVPMVIAGTRDDSVSDICHLAQVVRQLRRGVDVEFDDAARNVFLTDSGLERVEGLLHCHNLYDENHTDLLTRLNCALHAEFLLKRDVDYIVRHGRIELVDEFTGRVADKRRWPDGLQAALEAKEDVSIKSRGIILNSLTLQHFLQLYPKVSGMTATATTAADELFGFYHLGVVVIPPNRPSIRVDHKDVIFKTRTEKHAALIDEIISVSRTGRPILVGTASVEESATLAQALQSHEVSCEVLNAKNDEYEAAIIAQAGKPGAVTISTNMAGRGTDIRLGGHDEREKPRVMTLGGLYVIGTNRHESERIDRQLRGRAGRQGDPGTSRFFVSLEDTLLRKYGFQELLPAWILDRHPRGEIDNVIVRRELARLQRIVEGQNRETKKTLYKYSSIIEEQRKILFDRREKYMGPGASVEFFKANLSGKLDQCTLLMGKEPMDRLCREIMLHCIDANWSAYLSDIAVIREGIHLYRLGGQEPLSEFQKMAIKLFDERLAQIEEEAIQLLSNLEINGPELERARRRVGSPSSTWTYLINDDPFEDRLGTKIFRNTSLSLGVVWMWPFIVITLAIAKWKKKARGQRHQEVAAKE